MYAVYVQVESHEAATQGRATRKPILENNQKAEVSMQNTSKFCRTTALLKKKNLADAQSRLDDLRRSSQRARCVAKISGMDELRYGSQINHNF